MAFSKTGHAIFSTDLFLSGKGSVIALLALYIATFFSTPAGLPHVHHDDHQVHHDKCLDDPCHVARYHPGEKGGCQHASHLDPADSECNLCKLHVVHQSTPKEVCLFEFCIIEFPSFQENQDNVSYSIFFHHPGRAPPAVV